MKDYDGYLNRQAEVLNEFDDFCEQFEKRAAEQFKNPTKQDERFELLREIAEPGTSAGDSLPGDTGSES
jgi:hypothetical protein|tara:strand:+ start:23 stop:229 length:207 start_codon:yes stop_codon:yes gene_type:complete